jgi:putative transposase
VRSDWKVSIRRACSALRIDRALYVYKSRRGDQAALKGRIKDICETRVRYGYRRVHVLLQRDGWTINVKRVYRLYRELSLQLRNKTPKRRVKAKLREDRAEARQINETWAMDFVHDQLATGRKIRVLTIVDTFSRFSPAVDPRFSYRGEDVVLTLERICNIVGYPKTIRVDQDRSLSPAISISGLTRRVWCWISRGRENRRTTASSNLSTASSEANASTRTGS